MSHDLQKLEELRKHASISNEYIKRELDKLITLDAKTASFVARSMIDIFTAFAKTALPPDEFSAKALHILADSISYANEAMGIKSLETCQIAREISLHKSSDFVDDPWEEAS